VVLAWLPGLFFGVAPSVAVLTATGFALAVIGIWQPAIGFLGIGLLCTLDPLMNAFVFTGGLLRWNTFNYWLLLTLVLFPGVLYRVQSSQVVLLELFIGLLTLELLVSPDWVSGVQDILGIVAALGLLVYFARAAGHPSLWYWVAVLSGVAAAGGGFIYYLDSSQIEIVNPNALAFMPITAVFACCLGMPFATDHRNGQALLALLAALNLVLILLSGSRGAMLIGTASAAFLLLGIRGLGKRTMILALAALVVLAVASQFTALRLYAVSRVHLLLDPTVTWTDRTSGRSDLVLAGWRMFQENPFGIGTGGFGASWSHLGTSDGLSGWGLGKVKPAHAGWIKILVENGVPGVTLFVAFVASFVVTAWRSHSREVLLLGFLTTLVLGLGFLTTEYQSKGPWFIAAGVVSLFLQHRAALRQPQA
jgi:O-antigen ligase